MNIAWRDLNNVQEAGDYPFRDGTITVTFAEVAIWKTNPDALFQLMRKHPIQSTPRYALGGQVEQKAVPAATEFIHESSNGDAWYLTPDPVTGTRVVMHRANVSSGGHVSYVGIDKFLADGANGPEHQALRRLMETGAPLATLLIAYDIHPPKGEAYDGLIGAIQSLGTWWHHLETIWIVQCAQKPGEIRDRLKSQIGSEDQLLVVDISGDTAGWAGISDTGSKWLADNI
jgi:hypothetical protein